MDEEIGDHFQQATKYYPDKMPRSKLDWECKPKLYKEYPDSKKIYLRPLIQSESIQSMLLDKILRKRKSIRNFAQIPINQKHLSYLLWASSGIQRVDQGHSYRTAPSAGALYPIETYLVVNDVEDLDNGIYHYLIKDHMLEELKSGDFREPITRAALGQNMCARAAVVFIWTAIFYRSKWKYKQRAYRYIYLDMGHIAQNLALSAISLGLGSCQIGALYDDEVNKILDVDGSDESVIYMTVVGYPR